jgi:hypothetical protein
MFSMPVLIFTQFMSIPYQMVQVVQPNNYYNTQSHPIAIPTVPYNSNLRETVLSTNTTLKNTNNGIASFIPTIKIYRNLGEKPTLLLALKCPTESLLGFSTPSSKILHSVIDTGFDTVNNFGIMPLHLSQVCA